MKRLIAILILTIILVAGCISSTELTNKAIENKDISFCDRISDQGQKNQCYFRLSDFIPEACDKIVSFYCRGSPCFSDANLIGQCYLNLYNKTNDETYCVNMESHGGDYESIKNCFTMAGYSGDSLCKKFITSYNNFRDCYENDLKIDVNVTQNICINFSKNQRDQRKVSDCYRDLARVIKNESFCNLDNYLPLDPYYCIIDVAVAKNDTILCNQIPSDCFHCKAVDSCPKPIGNWTGDCMSFQDFCVETVKNGGYK